MLSGYAYQIRYAVYRAVWIAAGRDPLSPRAATIWLERRMEDHRGKRQWVDVVIEDAEGHPLELIETKEHDGFVPTSSIDSFLRRAAAMRGAVPPNTQFRFVCNQKLTETLDLSRDVDREQVLDTLGIRNLDGQDILWDLGLWSKAALVDRTMVLLARDGGDARDLYFQLYARASAQIALRRHAHAAASHDAGDLLADYYTDVAHRELPSVRKEPGLAIESVRHAINLLARERPPARALAEEKIVTALRRHLFREQRITTAAIFVEPLGDLWSPAHGPQASLRFQSGDATSLLLHWMNDRHEGRAAREPLLLLGTFGVGKSTFLTAFAHSLLTLSPWITPLLVPLRDLVGVADESLRAELERYLRDEYHVDFSQPPTGNSLRYVVLCDGFDELNLYYSRRDVQDWVSGAFGVLRSLAQRPDVAVVVSSRPILFMEQRRKGLAQPILTLSEFDEQRIDLWCANYRRARLHLSAEFNYGFLRERQLDEVARTPIVLYMLALLYEDGWLESKRYTKTDVFRTFVDWTEAGGYGGEHKHRLPANYREILQDIAWFLFRSGEERLEVSTLVEHLRAKYGTVTREQIGIGTNLLVAHMLQPAGGASGEETLIEFSHQSLREYLVAERLWRLVEPQRHGAPWSYEAWDDAAGATFTRAEIAFLDEMIQATPEQEALHLYERLGHLDQIAANVSAYAALSRRDGRLLELWDVAASTVLAYILRIRIFRHLLGSIPKRRLPSPPTDLSLRTLLDFTSALAQHGSPVRRLLTDNLNGLRLAPGAVMSNVEMPDAEMRDVVFKDADFKHAILPGIVLQSSTFTSCDFSHASIAAQFFFRNRFVSCDFTRAEIHIENEIELGTTALNTFSGCNFTKALFTGLVLRDSTFNDCTWDGATVDAEDPILQNATLDAAARRFFRSQKVPLRSAPSRRMKPPLPR